MVVVVVAVVGRYCRRGPLWSLALEWTLALSLVDVGRWRWTLALDVGVDVGVAACGRWSLALDVGVGRWRWSGR